MMTNDELKKKIVGIIRTADTSIVIGTNNINIIADTLIAAGIGDVKEAEMAANRYEMLYSMQARDMALAERKAFTYAAEIEHLNNKLNEAELRAEVAESELERYTGLIKPLEDENARLKHRAEVAERALMTVCTNVVKDEEDDVTIEPCARVLYKAYLKQAKKELAEEGKE